MPKKTKKQKIRSRQRTDDAVPVVHPVKVKKDAPQKVESLEERPRKLDEKAKITRAQKDIREQDRIFTSYFLNDLRKTGIAIAIILGIEGFIFYAFRTNMFSLLETIPF